MNRFHTLTGISPHFLLAAGGVLAVIVASVIGLWVAYRILTRRWLQAFCGLIVGLVFVAGAAAVHP